MNTRQSSNHLPTLQNPCVNRFGGVFLLTLFLLCGCDRSEQPASTAADERPPYAASNPAGAKTPATAESLAGPESSESAGSASISSMQDPTIGDPTASAAEGAGGEDAKSGPLTTSTGQTRLPASSASEDASAPVQSTLKLRDDLNSEELARFLAEVDGEIQHTWAGRSGIEDEEQLEAELQRVVKLKLEASRRLMNDEQADGELRSRGARGELQSLSHLAVLGDLAAAEQLESLAREQLDSEDPSLAADSRLVLIGFAVDALQGGDDEAAERIVGLVEASPIPPKSSDFPTLMAMGQARQTLLQYGYDQQARAVRDVIIDRFAGSPDPNVAELTARIAGNVKYDRIDDLLLSVLDGKEVTVDEWTQAAETLIAESADLQTVQYLAGAALEFESLGREELAAATLQSLANNFDDPATATGREVELAINARQARQQVIGRSFQPDLPGVGETSPELADYRGKVVLMPFWATGFPESLQLMDTIATIRDAHPDDVAILGMNLDVAGAPIQRFMESKNLKFDSYHAESSSTAKVANPVAARFGMVSMPFLVVLDRDGNVAAIKLSDHGLQETVDELIANPKESSG